MSGGGRGSDPSMGMQPPAVPHASPAVSNSSAAVTMVQDSLRRQQMRRKSIGSTMFAAGGMGGALPGSMNPGATGPSVGTGVTKTG